MSKSLITRFVLCCCILATVPLTAAEHADGQMRFFLRGQHFQGGRTLGFDSWLIAPDATRHHPGRIYGEAGPSVRRKTASSTSTASLLLGGYLRTDGVFEPAADLRLFSRRSGLGTAGFQQLYNFRQRQALTQLQLTFDIPRLKGVQLGGEWEVVRTPVRTVSSMGPRLVYMPTKHVSLALVYQFRPVGLDIARGYSGYIF